MSAADRDEVVWHLEHDPGVLSDTAEKLLRANPDVMRLNLDDFYLVVKAVNGVRP